MLTMLAYDSHKMGWESQAAKGRVTVVLAKKRPAAENRTPELTDRDGGVRGEKHGKATEDFW